ncbi:hypothetical protein [Sneathiella sp.]|uniref:hypothetical protein n=1 Tax=Sneathiella sp. TaxID=1964365 RepID=UPI0026138B19|nr:hypothetical protein [Sneathiella sp.]
MSGVSHKSKKIAPSAGSEGANPARRLYFKAANDNRAPLFYRLRKLSMILIPSAMLIFFAAAWYFGSN